MTNIILQESVHLTPAERYFRGEMTLDEATRAEVSKMREERRETRFGAVNVAIRVITLVITIPVLIISLFNPKRWC